MLRIFNEKSNVKTLLKLTAQIFSIVLVFIVQTGLF